MKLQKIFVLAAATAASALTYSAHAQVWTPPEIVLTQTSDTDLSATINGASTLTVVDLSPDNWFVYGFGSALINGSAQWSDPDGAGNVNTVGSSLDSSLDLGLIVHADVAAGPGTPLVNNTDDTTDFSYLGASFLGVNVTFDDVVGSNGNGTVPDAATTMPLLGVAVGGLFGLARKMRK